MFIHAGDLLKFARKTPVLQRSLASLNKGRRQYAFSLPMRPFVREIRNPRRNAVGTEFPLWAPL